MRSISSVSSRKKKAMLSLEVLVGIVLSVIALVFVYKFFATNFLNDFTNYDVAKQNAQSIRDFVNYGIQNSGNFNNCFFMYRLFERQLTQDKNQQKYFFVIDNEGIYILEEYGKLKGDLKKANNPKSTLKTQTGGGHYYNIPTRLEKVIKDYKKKAINSYKFSENVPLVMDDTSAGSSFIKDISYGMFGSVSKFKYKQKKKDSLIVLRKENNNLEGWFYFVGGGYQTTSSHFVRYSDYRGYLLFHHEKSDDILTVTDNSVTSLYASMDLCKIKKHNYYSQKSSAKQAIKSDFFPVSGSMSGELRRALINYKVPIKLKYNGQEQSEKFIWDISKESNFECEGCEEDILKDIGKPNCNAVQDCRNKFVDKINEYFKEKYSSSSNGKISRSLSFGQIKRNKNAKESDIFREDVLRPAPSNIISSLERTKDGNIKKGQVFFCEAKNKNQKSLTVLLKEKAYFSYGKPKDLKPSNFRYFNEELLLKEGNSFGLSGAELTQEDINDGYFSGCEDLHKWNQDPDFSCSWMNPLECIAEGATTTWKATTSDIGLKGLNFKGQWYPLSDQQYYSIAQAKNEK